MKRSSEKLLGLLEPALRRRIFRIPTHEGELLQNLALLRGEGLGDLHVDPDKLIALVASIAQRRHALSAKSEGRPALGAARKFERRFAKQGRHLDRSTQGGKSELDRNLSKQVVPLTFEEFVILDREHDVKIAGFATGNPGLAIAHGT